MKLNTIILVVTTAALLATPALLAHEPGQGPGSGGDGWDGPWNMSFAEIVVPAAGRGPGAQDSMWVTDLWLRGEQGDQVELSFHRTDSPSAAPTATATVELAQPVTYLHDVVSSQFGLEVALGNIVVRSEHWVGVTTRTYNDSGDGTYGSGFMGMPSFMGMNARGSMMDDPEFHQYWVQGLLPQPQARVNVMVANASEYIITGIVEVVDADGGVPATGPRSYRFEIQPFSSHQFMNVLAGVESRFEHDAGLQLRAQLDDGVLGRMMILASVVDNRTNDGYTVVGNMMFQDGDNHQGPMH